MKLNLQYFATEDADTSASIDTSSVGTGENSTGGADLSGANVEDGNNADGADGTSNPSDADAKAGNEGNVDMNAIYASARRRAEEEATKKVNAKFAARFGDLTNPRTGAKITSYDEYLDALDAQEQMAREEELKSQGVDTNLLNELISKNPTVRQANEILERENQRIVAENLTREVEEISKFDSSIKALSDVPKDVMQMAVDKHISILEAYKISNFGKWSKDQADSARQAAINQVKGKDHLKPVDGVAVDDNLVEIPANLKGLWQEMFPGKSAAELKKLYNKQL